MYTLQKYSFKQIFFGFGWNLKLGVVDPWMDSLGKVLEMLTHLKTDLRGSKFWTRENVIYFEMLITNNHSNTQMSGQKKKYSLCQSFCSRRGRRVFGRSSSKSLLKSPSWSTSFTKTSAARSFRLRPFHFLILSTFASASRLAISSWCHLNY